MHNGGVTFNIVWLIFPGRNPGILIEIYAIRNIEWGTQNFHTEFAQVQVANASSVHFLFHSSLRVKMVTLALLVLWDRGVYLDHLAFLALLAHQDL